MHGDAPRYMVIRECMPFLMCLIRVIAYWYGPINYHASMGHLRETFTTRSQTTRSWNEPILQVCKGKHKKDRVRDYSARIPSLINKCPNDDRSRDNEPKEYFVASLRENICRGPDNQ